MDRRPSGPLQFLLGVVFHVENMVLVVVWQASEEKQILSVFHLKEIQHAQF